ncbi:28S ribosomal protein S14, mitochondrial [Thrips palmi]|uniref:Small ribosomal subunit protein uS14 n=1 Tax=Thrips palmi TaxID=161013 RepID=A0A6P8ZJB0_THRPL|nr:28S ribosomal protein S14, mitochondrial [Thrips palmi]
MAFLQNGLRSMASLLFRDTPQALVQSQQVRTKFVNRMQIKDQKRRITVKKFGRERMLLNTLYRCKGLPPEIREIAHEDVKALPRDSNFIRLNYRCYATSRPRACIKEFRMSRIVFRHLADYNNLAAIQRAMW